jgi:hypothetical protein
MRSQIFYFPCLNCIKLTVYMSSATVSESSDITNLKFCITTNWALTCCMNVLMNFVANERTVSISVQVQVQVTLRLTVSQSVSLGVEPRLGLMTRYLLLFVIYGLVSVGRPLWREDGSVFCTCCWPLPAQSFLGPSPLGLLQELDVLVSSIIRLNLWRV